MSCAIWCETSLISSGSILNIMYIATVYAVCVTSQGLLSVYSYKRPYGLLLFVYILLLLVYIATKDRMDFCYLYIF